MPRGATSDLSLKTLLVLTLGLLLWLVYGALKLDWVIVAANGIGSALSGCVLAFKVRDKWQLDPACGASSAAESDQSK